MKSQIYSHLFYLILGFFSLKKRKERKTTALEELPIETVSAKQGKNWLVSFKYVPVFTLNLSLDLEDGDVTNLNLL